MEKMDLKKPLDNQWGYTLADTLLSMIILAGFMVGSFIAIKVLVFDQSSSLEKSSSGFVTQVLYPVETMRKELKQAYEINPVGDGFELKQYYFDKSSGLVKGDLLIEYQVIDCSPAPCRSMTRRSKVGTEPYSAPVPLSGIEDIRWCIWNDPTHGDCSEVSINPSHYLQTTVAGKRFVGEIKFSSYLGTGKSKKMTFVVDLQNKQAPGVQKPKIVRR